MMFLLRFLLFFGVRSCEGLYVSLCSYPLSLRAFWYGAMDSSKVSLLDEMVVNRLLMLSGMFFSNAGGWLLCWWTYDSLSLGFIYGL